MWKTCAQSGQCPFNNADVLKIGIVLVTFCSHVLFCCYFHFRLQVAAEHTPLSSVIIGRNIQIQVYIVSGGQVLASNLLLRICMGDDAVFSFLKHETRCSTAPCKIINSPLQVT